METIQDLLKRALPLTAEQSSPRAALEAYDHITLTDDEECLAILQAKQKKEALVNYQEEQRRIDENRKKLMTDNWDYNRTKNYFLYRSNELFGGRFILDGHNSLIFELLCRYFSNDKDFLELATEMGVENPSLDKGLLLAGIFGTGKTWMMKLFQKNKKNCFQVKNAKEIAAEFQVDGQEAANIYTNKIKNAFNDAAVFFQPFCGMCIDDLGTEQIKNNYGNKSNVIGDILEMRYAAGTTGIYLHATTNLTAQGIDDFYGGRIVSRMCQIFNIIELKGDDRRH